MELQPEQTLIWSTVVANCRMNRERGIIGVNSYEKELKLNILAWLEEKARRGETVHWLDIGCGTARALVEAATWLQEKGVSNVQIEGWDVAGLFVSQHKNFPHLQLVTDTIAHWQPKHTYDLITCVHGMHYIGDKLGLLQKCLSSVKAEGKFISNLDLQNIKKPDGSSWDRQLRKTLRGAGVQYNARQHVLSGEGPKQMKFDLTYLGANDQAGKNYTGQEVVDSYYQ